MFNVNDAIRECLCGWYDLGENPKKMQNDDIQLIKDTLEELESEYESLEESNYRTERFEAIQGNKEMLEILDGENGLRIYRQIADGVPINELEF